MSYSRNEGGYDNPSPWATTAPDEGNDMSKLLESLRNSAGSGTMSNLATSLVAQAVQKRPGGMLIGETHFGGQGSAPMGGPSFNNSEPHGGDRFIDRSGGRDDYPRELDNLAPLSNSSRSKPPFRRSRSRQSHYREVPRWEIFMGQELRFGQDMGRMADFPAFIASKSFDL